MAVRPHHTGRASVRLPTSLSYTRYFAVTWTNPSRPAIIMAQIEGRSLIGRAAVSKVWLDKSFHPLLPS
jgi:hypothetical protein